MQIAGQLLPIPFSLSSFPIDGKITICYDTGGPLLDDVTNTVNVPSFLGGFSGSLSLLSFTDDNGCAGTVNGSSISIDFNDAPDIVTPAPLEACDIGDGTALFVLSDLDAIINDNTALAVNYFSDDMGMNAIASPYQSGSATIYAQVI